MHRSSFIRRFFPLYLSVIFLSLLAVSWIAASRARRLFYEQISHDLEARARLIKEMLEQAQPSSPTVVDSLCKRWAAQANTRITIITPEGLVLGDSNENPSLMENHADRPEFRAALAGGIGVFQRYSPTLKMLMIYLAVPVMVNGSPTAVVRVAIPLAAAQQAIQNIQATIIFSSVILTLVTGVIGYMLIHRLRKQLSTIRTGAVEFARGNLEHKLIPPQSEELADLAGTLNLMAEQLHERIRTITRQRGELEAILASMVEGVMVFDSEERVLSMNRAATKLLGMNEYQGERRSVQEIILNRDFQRFVSRTIREHRTIEEGISFRNGAIYVQAHGSPLRDNAGRELGALVVVNDVTRLRQLENIRREFVANVSHELRTPITAIQGFVETLREGGVNAEETTRYLEIIARHSDRLNAIIEDLLSLSRLEQETENGTLPLQVGSIAEVLKSALAACEYKANGKSIHCELETESEAKVRMNTPLLEQAMVNLLDNAINYSEPGSRILVGSEDTANECILYVKDNGCGIGAEHVGRIFERFYRVDQTRSRKLGGTGLGLAIVKHIALAHNGQVSVDSMPGKGSTFRIHLPKS